MGVILRRKKDESVILKTTDGIVEIKIINGTNARLNITAPKCVAIWRRELLDDDYKLLPKHGSRTVKSSKQEEQNLCLHRRKSVHSSFNSTIHQEGMDG